MGERVQQARAELAEHRQQLNQRLDALDRKGRHASLRIMSIEEILRLPANHEEQSAEDMARALEIHVQTADRIL
jgi:hypothetical protein